MSEVAESNPSSNASEPTPPPSSLNFITVGELLIAARERCDLSAADIARQLRLALRQVEALEANQFQLLPGNTFVRGFIRNYAKVVQADAPELLSAYEQTRPQIRPQEIVTVDERIEYTKRPIPKWLWFLLGIVVLVLAAPVLIYFALRDDSAAVKAPVATAPALPAVSATAPATTVLSLPPPAAIPMTEPPQAVATRTGPAMDTAASTASPEPVAKPKPGESTLKFVFQDEKAWVEIRDKAGKVVFSQLNQPGSEQTIYGIPPFSLVVGNAATVRITYNGKPVDLTPHTKVNVARFTLE